MGRAALKWEWSRGALTTLRGVSQVLKRCHCCLCPLNIFFSFGDVEVLGGGLLRSLCCWLNKNIIVSAFLQKINSNPQIPEWDKHIQENSASHITGRALLKSHLLPQMPFPEKTFSLEGQDIIRLLWVEACFSPWSWYKMKHTVHNEHNWIYASTGSSHCS